MREINEAGIRASAIAKINEAITPSKVFSKPFTDSGSGNGFIVNSMLFFGFDVAYLNIALFI